jgi:hypothetical protein
MTTFRVLSLLAALGLAITASAQSQSPPDSTGTSTNTPSQGTTPSEGTPGQDVNPGAASSPHQRDVTSQGAAEAPTTDNPNPTGASSKHQRESTRMAEAGHAAVGTGMTVQTQTGQSLGTVVDVVPGRNGDTQSGYVVIAGSGGSATPVPYAAASAMVQNGSIVMDRSRFENAPKVPQSQLEDRSSKSWQSKADTYWGGKGMKEHSSDHSSGPSSHSERESPPQH